MTESNIMTRPIRLTDNWYKNYCGDITAKMRNGKEVQLVAGHLSAYRYKDGSDKKYCRVTKKNCVQFEKDALLHYRPLPENAGLFKLILYMLRTVNTKDIFLILLATMLVTLVGTLYPMATNLLFNRIIAAYKSRLLYIVFLIFMGIFVTGSLFSVVKNIMLAGVGIRMSTLTEAAFMGRCMVVSTSFYKQHPSGQVSEWLEGITGLCENVSNFIFGTWFSSLLSLLYIIQIYILTPSMTMMSILIVIAFFLICFLSAFLQSKWLLKQMQSNSQLTGVTYDLLSGIETIKLNNAGKHALRLWFEKYDEVSRYTYASPLFVRLGPVLPMMMSTLSGIIMLIAAHAFGLTSGEYMTFYSAFGMVLGSVVSAGQTANILASIKPQYEMFRPLLKAETEAHGQSITSFADNGRLDIEVRNVTFQYQPNRPVMENLSLRIPYGDYVAIVGSTGCGKSTLLRLLLGFEEPLEGSIRYNGVDISELNKIGIRQNFGVVLQNDRLLPGSILENMRMSNVGISEEEIWNALRMVGIDEEIRAMPMGLETIIGEHCTLSGGQAQRIHIARAILRNPSIFMMDEATSALDNETQLRIADIMDRMEGTRIIIAHRLSTIRNAKRILVLEEGHIVEEGTYEDLIARKQKFFNLVNRQNVSLNI